MKNHSYYQYMKTRLGGASSISILASYITKDPMFPKYTQDYEEISDYLEKNPYTDISLSVFDESYSEYQNWLDH